MKYFTLFLAIGLLVLPITEVEAKTCKQMRSCKEAVMVWCQGDSARDGDGDGIPCENLCRSKKQVDSIRRKIGC